MLLATVKNLMSNDEMFQMAIRLLVLCDINTGFVYLFKHTGEEDLAPDLTVSKSMIDLLTRKCQLRRLTTSDSVTVCVLGC